MVLSYFRRYVGLSSCDVAMHLVKTVLWVCAHNIVDGKNYTTNIVLTNIIHAG